MTLRRLSLGLYGQTYFGAYCALLNWWPVGTFTTVVRSAGGNLDGKAAWNAGTYLDTATGDLINPVPSDVVSLKRVFFAGAATQTWEPRAKFDGESWFLEWDGTATASIANLGTGGTSASVNANKLSFTFGTGPQNVEITLTVTNRNDPPRNVRVYQSRYATNVAAGEKFNPDWVAAINSFGSLRFMDMMASNNSCIQAMSQFADFNYYALCQTFTDGVSSTRSQSDFGPKGGIHPSVICAAATATGVPEIHVNIPFLASDSFVTAFATYFKNNTSTVVVYEFGNEHWNPGFDMFPEGFRQGAKTWGAQIQGMTAGNPTTVTFASAHNLTNGGNSDFYTDAVGWTSLDRTNQIVTVVNPTTITIPANTTGFPAFSSTNTWISQDFGRNSKWYGKRSCEMMKIIRDIYNDRTRWKGALGTQSVSTSVTDNIFIGVDYWRANVLSPANSLNPIDLFNDVYVTGYFGAVTRSDKITNITQAANGVVTTESTHPFTTGQVVRHLVTSGMTQLANVDATITKIDATSYSLNINTSGYSAFINDNKNLALDAKRFQLMDQSNSNFISNPVTYPTKYTYFNQQMATACMTGTCAAGVTTSEHIEQLKGNWAAQYAVAKARGLGMRQYEGGCHLVGDGNLAALGINSQYSEYLVNFGHSAEIGPVYSAMYKAFIQQGGNYASKFVEAGPTSQFGTWGGIRFWKNVGNSEVDDTGNPVWQATLDYNNNRHAETWTVRFGA